VSETTNRDDGHLSVALVEPCACVRLLAPERRSIGDKRLLPSK
jgi:hypothetical protein